MCGFCPSPWHRIPPCAWLQRSRCLAHPILADAAVSAGAPCESHALILHLLLGSRLLWHVKPHTITSQQAPPDVKALVSHRRLGPASCRVSASPKKKVTMPRAGPINPAHPDVREPSSLSSKHVEGSWQERCIPAPLPTAGCWPSKCRNIWGDQERGSVFFSNVLAGFRRFTGQHLSREVAVLRLERCEAAPLGLPKQPPSQPCSPCSFLCEAQLGS